MYTISFMAYTIETDQNNEEIIQQTVVQTLKVREGQTINTTQIRTPASINPGESFVGWYTDEDFTTPFDFTNPITQHWHIFAKFE
jgi:hypothetical protein